MYEDKNVYFAYSNDQNKTFLYDFHNINFPTYQQKETQPSQPTNLTQSPNRTKSLSLQHFLIDITLIIQDTSWEPLYTLPRSINRA